MKVKIEESVNFMKKTLVLQLAGAGIYWIIIIMPSWSKK
jgi:hypothetical protein